MSEGAANTAATAAEDIHTLVQEALYHLSKNPAVRMPAYVRTIVESNLKDVDQLSSTIFVATAS